MHIWWHLNSFGFTFMLLHQDEDWKHDPVQRQEEALEEDQAQALNNPWDSNGLPMPLSLITTLCSFLLNSKLYWPFFDFPNQNSKKELILYFEPCFAYYIINELVRNWIRVVVSDLSPEEWSWVAPDLLPRGIRPLRDNEQPQIRIEWEMYFLYLGLNVMNYKKVSRRFQRKHAYFFFFLFIYFLPIIKLLFQYVSFS